MIEHRTEYLQVYLTKEEMEMFDKLALETGMSYNEIVGTAIKAYYKLGELIKMHECNIVVNKEV